jgi:cytochrome c553
MKRFTLGFLALVALATVAAPTAGARDRPPHPDLQAFRDCMVAQGVEKPARGERPTEAQKATFEAAFEKCKSLLPEGLRERLEKRQAQREAFAECMREHGVTWPKPARGERPNLTDQQRETLRKALQACGDLRPHGPHGKHHGPRGGR